jgi:quinol-cytochrome oxidoreductase complex cytochrome b subunit/coenzyme F420-reducing hydrogenase delta subunit/Pyruvate/2-oxoacid:ferredoxin oxidoreductase delta subunit
MHPARALRLASLDGYRRIEHAFDRPFGAALNPWRNLGALGFMLFWLLAVSGIYLYAVLDTSAAGAYRSIDELSRQQWFLGGVLRSLHRYAADAFVLVMAAHLLRELLFGHYTAFRRFSWWTGVPLLGFAFVCAIGGFWLNWDQLGQFSAQATAEWIDALPLLAAPLTRNFINVAAVSDRLFSLFVFVHLGVPLLLVFALWFHIQRISRAAVFPPRALALGTLASLLALALAAPVLSHAPADLAIEPGTLALDWILLFVHPLGHAVGHGVVWAVLGIVLVWLLLLLPWLPQRAPKAAAPGAESMPHAGVQAPVAVVDPTNCNGCRRCFDDCPYAAVTMVPHPDKRLRQMAQVDADLCASCGICVGACPSSTPFRSTAELVTGIDMPSAPIGELRQRLQQGLAAMDPKALRLVVFGCDHGARVAALAAPDVAAFSLMCTGQLPPSFVEYALRDGADGVLVTGCAGCEFRLGQTWTADRLASRREPHLREHVPRERIALVSADPGQEVLVKAALQRLQQRFHPDNAAMAVERANG